MENTVIEKDRKLTNRQREFARFYVEGIYSNAECARKSGFAEKSAHTIASHLLNGKEYPHVIEHIQEFSRRRRRDTGLLCLGS